MAKSDYYGEMGAHEAPVKGGNSRVGAVGGDSMLNRRGITDSELPVKHADSTPRECQWSPYEQNAGGNLSGHDPEIELLMVPDFQGQSGQGANQSINRPKGST